MSSCVTVPTETQFQVVTSTSNSLSTSFSEVVTTLPGTTFTSTSTICPDATSNASCSSTVIIGSSGGSTSTTSVPVTLTVPVTFTTSNPTKTLFSTSCTSTSESSSTTANPTSSTSRTPSTSQSSISSSATPTSPISQSTPAPFTFTSSSAVTLSNGTVLTTDVVFTTTAASSVFMSNPPTPSLNQDGGSKSSGKTAPIVGGVVGGVVALLAVIGGIWYIWRRSKRWNDIFDMEEDEKETRRRRMSLDGEDMQPRPYHYGLVGHSETPSPPNSPPLGAVDRGHSPSNSLSLLNAPPHHSRSSSGGPLPSPGSMSRSLSDLGSTSSPTPQSGHVRPNLSTTSSGAASTRPLLERPVNHTRPPSSWSVGGQSIGPGTEAYNVSRPQSTPLSPRPHSAGGALQSQPAPAASLDTMPPPHSSPVNEKRRLLASLPHGAAAPMPPSGAIPGTASGVQFPQAAESRAPPIMPRNPKRPSSAKDSTTPVLVHVDGGRAATSEQQSGPSGNEPPAYSPT